MAGEDQTYAEGAGAPRVLAPGTQLGRFTLRRVLGEGGMGVVWAAHDPDLDREIAIKLLRTSGGASPALRKRLLREARAMARLKHPNVITVYEVGSSGDTDFIAMELVDGMTLDAWRELDPARDDIMRALLGAGRGLAAAHAAGLVHRDFKPHNVLRSRDGRVLVTDFGLARGLGDDAGEPVTEDVAVREVTPSQTDSLLDSPLTETGTMIGTPAYMAPEQFHGAPPDPRTDQFAYCVSAWQALTGVRPFTGETLGDLRDAALRGVDGIAADLAKPVRAVLARGLAKEPAARWPDMTALLDALEAAGAHRPRRVWPFIAPIAALAAAGAIALVGKREAPATPPAVCEPAAAVFAEAWSDEARRELTGPDAVTDRLARAFSQFRDRWTVKYQEACNTPRTKLVEARLACLRGVRDEAVVVRYMLRDAEPRVLADLNLVGVLPNLTVCSGPNPISPPVAPKEQPRRDKALAILARTLTLRWTQLEALPAVGDALVADAIALGWPPLVAIVRVTLGNLHLARDEDARARALFRAAVKTADVRFQAMAYLGLLEASIRALEDPGDPRELEKALTYARSAVRAAGDDPMLAGTLSALEARIKASQDQYRVALELAAEARKEFEKVGDLRWIARVAHDEADVHLARGGERALDDALFIVRSAEEILANAGFERSTLLDAQRARIAFARGDYREAHAYYDRLPPIPKARSPVWRGRVVDRSGKGVMATVVTFTETLRGDPVRVYTNPREANQIVETSPDGTFEIRGGDTLIAQAGSLRSPPVRAQPALTIVVEPTQSLAGTVTGTRGPQVTATATVGRYEVRGALGKDGAFRLDGVPRGATLGLAGPAGSGERRVGGKPLAWPSGATIELVVRARDAGVLPLGYVFRGKVAPQTRAEADALAGTADAATALLQPIGAGATEAGRETYQAGDRHAKITGNPPGEVTVCVALDRAPATRVTCTGVTVEAERGVLPVLFKT